MKNPPCRISAKVGRRKRDNSCFLCPFAKPNAKKSSAQHFTCLRQANPELEGGWSSRAAFHSTTQCSGEHSPAPHLILAQGQESCSCIWQRWLRQSAHHSSALCSPALRADRPLLLFSSQESQVVPCLCMIQVVQNNS